MILQGENSLAGDKLAMIETSWPLVYTNKITTSLSGLAVSVGNVTIASYCICVCVSMSVYLCLHVCQCVFGRQGTQVVIKDVYIISKEAILNCI